MGLKTLAESGEDEISGEEEEEEGEGEGEEDDDDSDEEETVRVYYKTFNTLQYQQPVLCKNYTANKSQQARRA
jgi:hypothetical protein